MNLQFSDYEDHLTCQMELPESLFCSYHDYTAKTLKHDSAQKARDAMHIHI